MSPLVCVPGPVVVDVDSVVWPCALTLLDVLVVVWVVDWLEPRGVEELLWPWVVEEP